MVEFTSLPVDVVDHILACIPDFKTLAAAIKVSNIHTYAVFQQHKQAILTSVALNFVGPSLPQALGVARREQHGDSDRCESINDAQTVLMSLKPEDLRIIETDVPVMERLEDLFSQMYKDRRSQKSVLTNSESLKLKRALYRLTFLYISIDPEPTDDDLDLNGQPEEQSAFIAAPLTEYNDQELLELAATVSFLQEVQRRTERFDRHNSLFPDTDGMLPFLGNPRAIYKNYYRLETSDWLEAAGDDVWFLPPFQRELRKVCRSKGLDEEATVNAHASLLVNQVYGAEDRCFRCNAAEGQNLYGRPNWHFLKGVVCGGVPLKKSLPGNLSKNLENDSILRHYFSDKDDSFHDWAIFTEHIFDFEMPDDQETWDKEQWYCQTCISTLFTSRFPSWWFAKRRDSNYPPAPEDCWYGWDCRTQTHKYQHARRLNHFCKPVRGDSVTPQ
ncbi:hypothetical protein BC835DRAFT_1368005 [Cytidiella melzeri]|nr:hypothetical protein BC835DRAFT_1368005 [Cytidiella melzeri]